MNTEEVNDILNRVRNSVNITEEHTAQEQNETVTSSEETSEEVSLNEIMNLYFTPTDATENKENYSLTEEQEDNLKGVIVRDETSRFSSAEWFEKAQSFGITIAGLGGIGSWSSLLISRLRPSYINLYDDDTVELGNLSGQLYGIPDVGLKKSHAMTKVIREDSNYYSIYEYGRLGSSSSVNNILICGFDNMRSRKLAFSKWLEAVDRQSRRCRKECLFIDGRLTATEFQVFCITGEDTNLIERYQRDFLFDDSEAAQEICSFKQTAYLANMIASVITNLYVNFCANLCDSPFKRTLPFITTYNSDMMVLNKEY